MIASWVLRSTFEASAELLLDSEIGWALITDSDADQTLPDGLSTRRTPGTFEFGRYHDRSADIETDFQRAWLIAAVAVSLSFLGVFAVGIGYVLRACEHGTL